MSKFSICAVELYTMEVSVLGFQSDLSEFCAAARLPVLPDYIKTEISKVAINSSYNIHRLRNSADKMNHFGGELDLSIPCRHYFV